MSRMLAGTYGPPRPAGRNRPAEQAVAALGAGARVAVRAGALAVATTGHAPRAHDGIVCILDGWIDGPDDAEQRVATLYRRDGEAALASLRGEFALLLWDEAREVGLLARDQLGARVLYVHEMAGRLTFASDVAYLLRLLAVRPAPDPARVVHWLAVSPRPGDATPFAGVRALTPGGLLRLAGATARESRYWVPHFEGTLVGDPDEHVERVRAALKTAVKRRIPAAGATGVLLSGGLDSVSVAALAAEAAPGGVSCYAGVFPDHPATDESALIDVVGDRLSLPLTKAEVHAAGLLESARDHIAEWALPIASWGDFWQVSLLRRAVADGATVMLGGDGGDEVFGLRGYLLADRVRHLRPRAALALARRIPGAGDQPPRRALLMATGVLGVAGALPSRVHALIRPATAPEWLNRSAAGLLRETADPYGWKRIDAPRWWAHAVYLLTDGLEALGALPHFARRARSAGVDARHALLDIDLVELTLKLPPESSFDPRLDRRVFRAATAGYTPDEIRLRPGKAMFDDLIIDALIADLPDIRRLLCDGEAESAAFVDRDAVRAMLVDGRPERHPRGRFAWAQELWRLTTAELWLRAQR